MHAYVAQRLNGSLDARARLGYLPVSNSKDNIATLIFYSRRLYKIKADPGRADLKESCQSDSHLVTPLLELSTRGTVHRGLRSAAFAVLRTANLLVGRHHGVSAVCHDVYTNVYFLQSLKLKYARHHLRCSLATQSYAPEQPQAPCGNPRTSTTLMLLLVATSIFTYLI